ncbi:MAG: hypothetical protein WC866_03765 [Patescibacteria group bacterium]|jgi:hypothetical protein
MKKTIPVTQAVTALALLGIGILVGVYFASKNSVSTGGAEAGTNSFEVANLPNNSFDATESIPETSVKVSYPKNGFYGLGVKTVQEGATPNEAIPFLGGVAILPNVSSLEDRPFSLSVGAYKKSGADTLEGSIVKGEVSGVKIGKQEMNGTYLTVNNHRYFVYKVLGSPTQTAWHAVSFGKKEVIIVSFEFVPGSDSDSYTAFRNNDQLFFQILSHISFE